MDQQHQHIPDDHHPPNIGAPQYAYYPQDQDPSYGIAYPPQISPYHQVVPHPGSPPRHLSATDLHQQGLSTFHNLSLMSPNQYHPQPPVYGASSPHVGLPISASPPPPSPNMYDPLTPPISGSDTSADGLYHHSRNSSGTGSPSSSRGNSLVHRHIRYNPTPSPTSSSGRNRSRSINESDDEDMGVSFTDSLAFSRKEATRKQRIEAEQRRRDELRDGYAKLKDVLPVSNQKSSKVSLLERATNHIVALEKNNQELQARIMTLEQEVVRLRGLNEKISLGVDTPSPGHSASTQHLESRPMSPTTDSNSQPQSLAPARGQEPPPEESSSVASENGY